MIQKQQTSQYKALLTFNQNQYLEQALTFKQYIQEHNSKFPNDKITKSNEMFIEFGNEMLNFFFIEFQLCQKLENDDILDSSFQQIKTQVMTEQNLARMAKKIGLLDKIKLSIKPNSPLKDQPKIQAQSLKALIGAQYFDKQKNLNEIRKLLLRLFFEITDTNNSINDSITQDDSQQIKIDNPKGEFLEFLQKNKQYYHKIIQEEIKEENNYTYTFEINLNDIFPVKKSGKNKKEVEKKAYEAVLILVNKPIVQSIIKSKTNNQSLFLESEIDKSYESQELFKFSDDLGELIDNILKSI